MKFVYANPLHTLITVTLDDGESLGSHHGPLTITVPVEEANTEYAELLAKKLKIEPYAPPHDDSAPTE